jgi:hypothetical protein
MGHAAAGKWVYEAFTAQCPPLQDRRPTLAGTAFGSAGRCSPSWRRSASPLGLRTSPAQGGSQDGRLMASIKIKIQGAVDPFEKQPPQRQGRSVAWVR